MSRDQSKKPLLDRLREKTELQKRHFSFLASLCVTGLIALIWLISFMVDLSTESEKEIAEANEPAPSPALIFKSQIENFFQKND